ncbi:hypothetical protein KP509_01G084800 [Ceratopteris richardii]|uniref:DUF7866 domain-containing protein n=1 Tax=Ceratopteris richardii TaxID=49495 RepID=A0A8T2VN52_CERRI|nr:hypothetical protein KP509_01G084800 [Ceratopteris richardii]
MGECLPISTSAIATTVMFFSLLSFPSSSMTVAGRQQELHATIHVHEKERQEARMETLLHGKNRDGHAWVQLANGTKVLLFPVKDNVKRFEASSRTTNINGGGGLIDAESSKETFASAFATCARCKCCDVTQTLCLDSPCCFNIVCGSPSQPFGVCSLTPSTCHCVDC